MGMDFSALLQCDPTSETFQLGVNRLEQRSPDKLRAVLDRWNAMHPPRLIPGKVWVPRYAVDSVGVERPKLPCLELSFRTEEGFYLTFGRDAVCIYHCLRWRTFLTDAEWQFVMLEACRELATLFGASACVVTRDESPVILAFFEGASFDDALATGEGVEGEVSKLDDLLEIVEPDGTWDSHGYFRLL